MYFTAYTTHSLGRFSKLNTAQQDECHSQRGQHWRRFVEACPKTRSCVIEITPATAEKLNRAFNRKTVQGRGVIYTVRCILDEIVSSCLTGRLTPALRACASSGATATTAGNASPAPRSAPAALLRAPPRVMAPPSEPCQSQIFFKESTKKSKLELHS